MHGVSTMYSKKYCAFKFPCYLHGKLITMKKTAFTVSFFLIIFAVKTRAQTEADEPQIAGMLKTFYTAYMSAFTAPDVDHNFEKTLVGLRKKYCTAKCRKQFGELVESTDGDPIINGQDSDAKWAKTLVIKRDPKTANHYSVSYSYDEYGEDKKLHKSTNTINLAVVKEAGVFKIDKILNNTSKL